MSHSTALTDRLPTLYRDGDLVRGLAGVIGLQLEILDAEARSVQKSHWFDGALELAEAAALGRLLDIPPEPWQELGEYRAWFHALRTARLEFGAVTREAITEFVRRYVEAFEATNSIDALPPFTTWSAEAVDAGHALVENPPWDRTLRLGGPGGVQPLHQEKVQHGGLDPALLSVLFTGGRISEPVPVLANRTTGEALLFLGEIQAGDRLWITAAADGTASAQLNRHDATSALRTIRGLRPGTPWTAADVSASDAAPMAITLRPGPNDLWFLPVAHFDQPGLDRPLLSLADLDLTQGRFDESSFDAALFYQDAAAFLDLAWKERPPAAFRVDLDASSLTSPAGGLDDALQAVDQLQGSVGAGVARLAAAGVASEVRFRPLHDSQRQLDHLIGVSGLPLRDVGSVGTDRLPDAGGLFSITGFGESTYQ